MHARALDHGVGHRMGGVACLPKVRAQTDYGDVPGIGVADLPGRAVVHLGAVQDGHYVRGGVDRVTATGEYVLFGGWPEGR